MIARRDQRQQDLHDHHLGVDAVVGRQLGLIRAGDQRLDPALRRRLDCLMRSMPSPPLPYPADAG